MLSVAPDNNTKKIPAYFVQHKKNTRFRLTDPKIPSKPKIQTQKNPSDLPFMPILEWNP